MRRTGVEASSIMRLHHAAIPHRHSDTGGAFIEYLILVVTILIGAGAIYAISLLGALNTGGLCNSAMAMTDAPGTDKSYFEQALSFSPSGRSFVREGAEVSCKGYSTKTKETRTVFTVQILTRFD
jgi:hypothetical protein